MTSNGNNFVRMATTGGFTTSGACNMIARAPSNGADAGTVLG